MNKLENEISGDPLGRGYAAMADQQLLDSLNLADLPRNRTSMTGREVKAAFNVDEYNALSATKKQQAIELTNRDDLNLFGMDRDILVDIFGAGSITVANLAAARVKTISPGVEIGWGEVKMRDLRMHTVSRK